MTRTSPQKAPAFTLDGYRGLLKDALAAGYSLVPIRAFSAPSEGPVMILRHDLDHTLDIGAFARAEAELGARSTYFVQTACAHYNLLAPQGRAMMRELTELGHEVGLHYDAARYAGPNGRAAILADIGLLADLSGQEIVSAAQHIPSDGGPVDLQGLITNDAYDARFTAPPMNYISDSIMTWRQARPDELIAERASFQFLTHPEIWTGRRDIAEVLTAIAEDNARAQRRLFSDTADYYAMLLAERAERDAQFRKERGWSVPETTTTDRA